MLSCYNVLYWLQLHNVAFSLSLAWEFVPYSVIIVQTWCMCTWCKFNEPRAMVQGFITIQLTRRYTLYPKLSHCLNVSTCCSSCCRSSHRLNDDLGTSTISRGAGILAWDTLGTGNVGVIFCLSAPWMKSWLGERFWQVETGWLFQDSTKPSSAWLILGNRA